MFRHSLRRTMSAEKAIWLRGWLSFLPAGYARSVSNVLELLEAAIVGIACAGHRQRGLRVAWTTNRGAIGFAYRR